MVAFGGALPCSRRLIVERRRWMTAEEFQRDIFVLAVSPRANMINFSVVFGTRFGARRERRWRCSPHRAATCIIASRDALCAIRQSPKLGHILSGIAAAAACLLIAMTAKMAMPLFKRGEYFGPIIAALVFVAIGPALPLQWVLIVLAPLSVAIACVAPMTAIRCHLAVHFALCRCSPSGAPMRQSGDAPHRGWSRALDDASGSSRCIALAQVSPGRTSSSSR